MKKIVFVFILLYICLLSFSQTDNAKSTRKIQYYHSVDVGCGFYNQKSNFATWGVAIRETHGMLIKQHVVVGLNIKFMYNGNYSYSKQEKDALFLVSAGLDLRYFILKKYKWTPFLMFDWNVGTRLIGHPYRDPIVQAPAFFPFYKQASIYAGANYTFEERKSVYMAMGYDSSYLGMGLRVGVRF